MTAPEGAKGKGWKARLLEYGKIGLFTYLGIFAIVFAGFALAIGLGFHVESTAGRAGLLGAAYVATKLTQPIRIAATLALTPLVARVFPGRPPAQT